jgi:hypothetical protein
LFSHYAATVDEHRGDARPRDDDCSSGVMT